MIELRVQGLTDAIVELYENESINLSYEFSSIQNLDKTSTAFSQTFRIPASENNIAIFGDLYDVNTVDYNTKQKSKAIISQNGTPIIEGYVQVKNIYRQKEKYADYEIIVFGETSDLGRELGDDKLSDLDYSSLDELISYDNVSGSWVGDNDLRYALIDKGRNWGNGSTGSTNPVSDVGTPIYAGDFTPSIRVPWIVQRIFDYAGFILDSDFFTGADTGKMYMPFYNNTDFIIGDETPETSNFNIGLTANNVIAATNQAWISPPVQLSNWSDSGNFFDTGGNVTVGATTFFTAPYTGVFRINWWVNGTKTTGPSSLVQFSLFKNGQQFESAQAGNQESVIAINQTHNIFMNAGDTLTMGITSMLGTNNFTVNGGGSPDPSNGTGMRMVSATYPAYGVNSDLSANAPDIKLVDVLTSLANMFNLVFVPDKTNPKKIKVEPFNDYLSAGDTVDWTTKLDQSKDIVITPVAEFEDRVLEFTYKEDGDLLNKLVRDEGQRIYGRKKLDNPDNDFATNEKTVKLEFSPTPCNLIEGTEAIIPKFIDSAGKRVKANARVLYWGGTFTANLRYYQDNGDTIVIPGFYPHFSHYSTQIPSVEDFDLNFGEETPIQEIQAQPVNNLTNLYWRDYLRGIYSDEARFMTAYFELDFVDISTFEFNDKIYVKDALWRINKISGYQVDKRNLTKVELVKIISLDRLCEYVPVGTNTDNTIIFEDANSVQSDGSLECCEFWGYRWDTPSGKCLAPINPPSDTDTIPDLGTLANVNDYDNLQQNVIAQGRATSASPNTTVSGIDINVKEGSQGTIAHGEQIQVEDAQPYTGAFGIDMNILRRGLWYGGGSRVVVDGVNDVRVISSLAHIIMSAEGSLELEDEEIQFKIPITEESLRIPDLTTVMIDCNISLMGYNRATTATSQQFYKFQATLLRDDANGILRIGNNWLNTLIEDGDHLGAMYPDVRASLATGEFTFHMVSNGPFGGNKPSPPDIAAASLDIQYISCTTLVL
jgi:hypothetical protein